jgi:hypothetical protein
MRIRAVVSDFFKTVVSVLVIAALLLVFVVLSPFIFVYHAACFVYDYACLCWDYLRTRVGRRSYDDR